MSLFYEVMLFCESHLLPCLPNNHSSSQTTKLQEKKAVSKAGTRSIAWNSRVPAQYSCRLGCLTRGGRCGNPSLFYSETRRASVCHQPPHVFKSHAVQERVTDSHWEAVSVSSHKQVVFCYSYLCTKHYRNRAIIPMTCNIRHVS
jgi:hypothetical protein